MTTLLVRTKPLESDPARDAAPVPPLGPWETTTQIISLRVGERPITFDEFVRLPDDNEADKEKHIELIDGVITERMAAKLIHELLRVYLVWLLHGYADARDLGIVLGSRTAVRVSEFRGRLPDLLFVRANRVAEIVREEGVYGPPDLIIELASPNDYCPHLLALETDYCTLGVGEIVVINQARQTVRIIRRGDEGESVYAARYDEQNLSLADDARAALTLESLPGFSVALADIFTDTRPKPATLLARLLGPAPSA